MSARPRLSPGVSDIVDEATRALRRVAAPWLGVLWLTSIPLRLAQVHFYRELYALDEPSRYGDHLGRAALFCLAALLPALWGRAVFVRACTLGLLSGARPGREALRPPAAPFANFLLVALLVELLFHLLAWTWVGLPLLILLGGLAAVTPWRTERPGLIAPVRALFTAGGSFPTLLGLLCLFGVALFIVYLNTYLAMKGAAWTASTLLGQDLSRWEYLLRGVTFGDTLFEFPFWPAEGLVRWICLAATVLIVEPFWLASLNVAVHRARFTQSGEDLHRRLAELRTDG